VEQLMRGVLRKSGRAGHQGFTLLEIMIALSILAVGLIAISAMQIRALAVGRSGKTDTVAMTITQDKMEDMARKPWTHADLNPTGNWVAAQTLTRGTDAQNYLLDWRVSDVLAGWTRSLDVRVRWSTPGRPNRTRVLSSIRYNREDL
jgi:type IV pilus assembly protein PilV